MFMVDHLLGTSCQEKIDLVSLRQLDQNGIFTLGAVFLKLAGHHQVKNSIAHQEDFLTLSPSCSATLSTLTTASRVDDAKRRSKTWKPVNPDSLSAAVTETSTENPTILDGGSEKK